MTPLPQTNNNARRQSFTSTFNDLISNLFVTHIRILASTHGNMQSLSRSFDNELDTFSPIYPNYSTRYT